MIARVLPDLETLPPFHLTDVEELRQSVETLFTEEAAEQIADYAKQFHTRALDQAELWVQVHYDLSNNPIRHPGKQLLEQEKAFLSEFKNKKPEPIADRHKVRISLLWWEL